MTTITEAFELPEAREIQAMGFVVKLRELDPRSSETAKLVDDYVVTPAVATELPRILDGMQQVYARGEEYGRFVHGSFGSGKSHFMTMLSLLIEGAPSAWEKFRPHLEAHREAEQKRGKAALDHEGWLREAGLLVVRIHMLSISGKTTTLDRAVYEGFNQALKRRGKAPFVFLNVEGIFAEVRAEAEQYGEQLWKGLAQAGILGGREDFDAIASPSGTPKSKETFARAWLAYKKRNEADAGIDTRWSEGLHRMTEHARAEGFGGIVLMIDEFLLWLAEKSGEEFTREINNLNVIVDHNTGQRKAPVFVFVARQRNLKEFFPDLVSESKIHDHLNHHSKRFEETRLQDVELRHIVKGRVLRPRAPELVKAAVEQVASQHEKALPALLAGGDVSYLRDVYPFHPALIETLVDVTSLMQRERSALRLLYELLVIHYPTLPLGEFLPVGSAFDAIFPEAGVEASQKVELMQELHHQYYLRLRPAMARVAEDATPPLPEERRRALDQFVKTVLLAEVSPRLKQGGLTIERLVQLNSVDVNGETYRGQLRVAEIDLQALSNVVPDLQLSTTGKGALVHFSIGRVSLGELLSRARSKVETESQRFRVLWTAMHELLELKGQKGFDTSTNEGDFDIVWRRTKRRGALKFGNVRELSPQQFIAPAGSFKVLIDYPWDTAGHSVDEDRQRALSARKQHGTQHTVCWLPRHMSPNELSLLTDLAAVRYLQSEPGQQELLDTLAPQDRKQAIEQASGRQKSLEGQLRDTLRDVYINHGEFHALLPDVDSSRPRETLLENLEHIAALLMDRRYPQHPQFVVEPKKADLELLLGWMIEAGETSVSVQYSDAVGKVLKNLGQPLELVNLGQTKASLRLDSRYLKDVLARADVDSLAWAPIADHLRDTYGFQPLLIDLFLCFLCQRDHRALRDQSDEPVEVTIGMSNTASLRLQRGQLVSMAAWARLRDLGHELFDVARPTAQRSLQSQDRYVAKLREPAKHKRDQAQTLHAQLAQLGLRETASLDELATVNARLAPLVQKSTDSQKLLLDLLAAWPDESGDPLRKLVLGLDKPSAAVEAIDKTTRKTLQGAVEHRTLGAQVSAHLAVLDERLGASLTTQLLTLDWAQSWNKQAVALMQEVVSSLSLQSIAAPQPTDPTPKDPTPEPTVTVAAQNAPSAAAAASSRPGAATRRVSQELSADDGAQLEAFFAAVKKQLGELGQKRVTLSLSITTDGAGE